MSHSRQSTEHLAEYLRYTTLCLKRYVARHAHRMLQANGTLNDLYVSFHEAHTVTSPERKAAGEESVAARMGWPSEAEIDAELSAHAAAMASPSEGRDRAREAGRLPIENLRQLFHLTERQVRVLIAAAAPHISIDLSRLYAFAWADFSVKKPSVGFIAELLADDGDDVARVVDEFRGDNPLVRYRLVELDDVQTWGRPTPLLHKSVRVPNRIGAYLQGSPEPLSVRIADTCELTGPEEAIAIENLVIDDETARDLSIAIRQAIGEGRGKPRLLMVGGDGVGRSSVLRSIFAPYGWGVLAIDLARLVPEGERFEESLVEICREALLRRCLLLIRGGVLLADRAELTALARPLCRVLEPYEGPLALTSSQRAPLLHRYISDLFEIAMPIPSASEQRDLWTRAASELGCGIDPTAPALLTQRFSVSPGAIYHAVEEARARSALFSPSGQSAQLRVSDLGQAIRRKTVHALGSIAQPFSTRLSWDDVVLPEDVLKVLKEILSHARHREKVYDDWGFGAKIDYGRGLSCLFAGPPGTGKTMMAAVLAQTLGREIYRVDISRVVSKWVGETEKNLALAFDEAERGQLILLFDEADALFSKRTKQQSSHDRFANMEINYLLQRMEAYDGMTILTSNKEKAIDEAFKRRLKFKVTFPMPDAKLREMLWRSMIPSTVRVEDDIPFDFLGEEFEMAGGHIKNAVLRAAFYAAEEDGIITSDHLYQAALQEAREMGMVVRDASKDI